MTDSTPKGAVDLSAQEMDKRQPNVGVKYPPKTYLTPLEYCTQEELESMGACGGSGLANPLPVAGVAALEVDDKFEIKRGSVLDRIARALFNDGKVVLHNPGAVPAVETPPNTDDGGKVGKEDMDCEDKPFDSK
ncbi:unnamed protein product [Orchesella dallaii]|uniref:Uncharacterized protein n=1 Tax=Orchesella dallaii TaxID=48710 RepID=A0ABP1PTS6_9HEXA